MFRQKKSLGISLLVAMVLFAHSPQAIAAPRSVAYLGQPFGVGRVTVDVLRGEPVIPLSDERFTVLDDSNRVIYPVLKEEPGRRLLRQLLEVETPRAVTIYYLFRGNDPFDLLPFTPIEQAIRVKPQNNERAHRRLLGEWWKQYSSRWQRLQKDPQYPPIAENFLTATLARRLGKTLPESKRSILPWSKQQKISAFDELFVSESHQLRLDVEMLQHSSQQAEMQLLPAPVDWAQPEILLQGLDEVVVEPMAPYVPEECFYLRFGNFTNYLWFRDLNKKWQGDLGNMISRRGIDRASSQRIQQQLSLRESALAKILGPQVIADAAIIGLDPYVSQGAAIGILFQAKNNFLLSKDLTGQRQAALKKYANAEETKVTIAGQEVSLIATPEGQVRSYYAQSNDFHLVTTSRTLAKRFLEAGQGTRSLANLPSFRHARREMSVERDDTVFAFISPKFFQNLCSPHYRIEVRRRVQSSREPHLLELARRSAAAEGFSAVTREQLVEAGILPAGFATRTDESQLLETETGWVDSLRGASGFYVPVGDMVVKGATATELAAYQKFIDRFRADIGQMPPIAIGAKRVSGEGGETMIVDVLAAPLGGLKLGSLAEMLGEPSDQQLQRVEGDVASFQAVLDVPVPLVGGESQPHHLFGGLRDFRSPLAVKRGAVVPGAMPAELIRGYLGAWPKPGLLALFSGPQRPTGKQPERVGEQIWQAGQDDFLLLSFKPEVIEQVFPQIKMIPAKRPSQIRLRIDDLTGKEIANTVNAFGYMRARETSVAASRLMNTLANQLHVPRDECREFAERLVDGKFVCPLGGEYQLYAPKLGLEVWTSSAFPEQNRFLLSAVPEDFSLPLLTWFRGIQGDLTLSDQSLSAHLELKMTNAATP